MKWLVISGVFVAIFVSGVFFTFKQTHDVPQPSDYLATASYLRELKEEWKTRIQNEGGYKAYADFLIEAPLSSTVKPHEQAHAFGEALYEVEGITGLSLCDSSFEFGCYHSFFGVAVQKEGIQVLPQFNEACSTRYGDRNLPCQHGIGHGVLVYTDYENLEQALELCETISALPTGGCSSGVFMEYNFHTMDESSDNFIRDATDLYSPCNNLAQRFQASCYFEQVQWWQSIFKSDFVHIGQLCSTLPESSAEYTACYNGIGNYATAFAKFQYEGIFLICSKMPNKDAQYLCYEGALWLVSSKNNSEITVKKLCDILELDINYHAIKVCNAK